MTHAHLAPKLRAWNTFGLLVVLICFAASSLSADEQDCESRQRPAPAALQSQFESKLQPLKQCVRTIDDVAACNRFVGRALEVLFGNSDFKNGDQYFLANDIANGIATPGNIPGWSRIGEATDQAVLDRAQALANTGAQVVALKTAQGAGHVVVILPGQTEKYPRAGFSWGDLKAPNSASFFLNHPERVFVGCPLSITWKAPASVAIYAKQ
jgi:hypothetical protein